MNEGFTIEEDGVNNRGDSWMEFILKPFNENKKNPKEKFKDFDFSFVKVSNLEYHWDFPKVYFTDGNSRGIDISVNGDDLVKEWVGIVLHDGVGVTKESMIDWLERYGGGIESINDKISMSDRFDVEDFDLEIIPVDEMCKKYPILHEILGGNK